jgi:hypothetical protein
MAAGNGSLPYSVAFPQPLLDQLRAWADEAKRLGVGAEFLAALRDIRHRLKTNPHGWGDRLREYPVINAAEMRGMIPKWLLVWYGVHDQARQVVVRQLLPAPGSPLSPPPTS